MCCKLPVERKLKCTCMKVRFITFCSVMKQTSLQCGFVQRGFDYTPEYKCEKLFTEGGRLDYTRSAKHGVVAFEKYHYCLKAPDGPV
jgi:hypothetical protein